MSKGNRKLTSQIKKLREILGDTLGELELLKIDDASSTVKKGVNVLDEMERDNENERR